jgi:peptidoglycan hydrolase-like protein with peptidoglycan-binding domain
MAQTGNFDEDRGTHRHGGIDLAPKNGGNPDIQAAMQGRIVEMGWVSGYGNFIEILHPDGSKTRYGHLKEFNAELKRLFDSGQPVNVTAGQNIAVMGSTGRSTGVHLHFEVIDANNQKVDPAKFLAGSMTISSAPKSAVETLSAISSGTRSSYIRNGSGGPNDALGIQTAQLALLAWATETGNNVDQSTINALKAEQASGKAGPATEAVIKAFQKQYGLSANGELFAGANGKGLAVDGILGIRTLNALSQWVVKNSSLSSEIKETFGKFIYSKEKGNLDSFIQLTNGVWGGKEGVSPLVGDKTESTLNKIANGQQGLLENGRPNGAMILDAQGKLIYERYEQLSAERRKLLESAKEALASTDENVRKAKIKELNETSGKSGFFFEEITANGKTYYAMLAIDAPEKALTATESGNISDFFINTKSSLQQINEQPKPNYQAAPVPATNRTSTPPAPSMTGKSMLFYRTGEIDPVSGNPLGMLALYDNGKLVASIPATTGRKNTQDRSRNIAGNLAPLPNGEYTVGQVVPGDGNPEIMNNKFIPITPRFQTNRSALGIHGDTSRDGTHGCIGFLPENYQQNMATLAEFTRSANNEKILLRVNY